MVINIFKQQDLTLVQELQQPVKEVIKGYVEILEENYITTFKEEILKGTIAEYIEDIEGADYISALFLLSSDFAIVVICEKKLRETLEQ